MTVEGGSGEIAGIAAADIDTRANASLARRAAADRDLLSLSAKTRILQLRTQQIDHCLG